jgi:hypothetical protein
MERRASIGVCAKVILVIAPAVENSVMTVLAL